MRGLRIVVGIVMMTASVALAVFAAMHGRLYVAGGLFIAGAFLLGRGVFPAEDPKPLPPTPARDARGAPRTWATESVDQPWTIGEAIGVAMKAFVGRFGSVVGGYLLYVLAVLATAAANAYATFRLVPELLHPSSSKALGLSSPTAGPTLIAIWAGATLLALVIGVMGTSQLTEAALAAIRDEPIAPGRFGRALRRTPKMVGFTLLFILAALVPTGLLAMPIALTPFFIVDEDASLGHALRKSWRMSRQYIGGLWLYHMALAPLTLLGTGTYVFSILTAPFYTLGLAYAYVRATGRSDIPWFEPDFSSRSIRRFLRVTFVALLTLFGVLFLWVRSLPTLRGAAWSVKDTAIRASAILSGVAAIIVLLALLLPYVLDRLEGRRFTSFVAARHVRSQKSGFLTVISILSICGVAISSCALSSVVSVMGGFSQDLKRKILGNNAHIVVDTTSATPFADYEGTLNLVRGVPGVTGATPVVRGEVMASSASNLAGVIVTGIDPGSILGVVDLAHNIEVGKLDYLEHPEKLTKLPANEVIGIGPGGEQYYKMPDLPAVPDDIDPAVRAVILPKADRPGIVLGRELAKTLHVYVGDEVTLVSPLGDLGPMGVMPRTKKFRVAAVFYSGMYEYDATYVYTMMDVAQEYFQTGGKISGIEIKVEEAERAEQITPKVVAAIARPELRVRDWREINKNLFSALKLERFATFVILSIAIMVASFCIVCTLLLMVTEKGKEIAILKAVGASDGSILRIFMIEGIIIGGIGTVFGVVTGLAVCTGLSWFGLRLDPEVYYIDRLPISVNGWDFLTVAAAALTICTLSTLYPAFAASRLRPVDGLRYE